MITYLKNWDFMRVLRLAAGVFIIMQGVYAKEWLLIIVGGMFTILPLLNIGCCGVSGCSTSVSRKNKVNENR